MKTDPSAQNPVRLGILLSGRGSNFLAIAESIRAGRLEGTEIAVVISNVAEAEGLAKARELRLAHQVFASKGRKREEHDAEMIACLKAHRVSLVCLAGYMRMLSPEFVAAGCTVHFVDEHLDHGAIVLQRAIPVRETDDAHSLAGRILVEEHLAYTEAIARVASGEYEIRGRRFVKRNL